GRATRRARAAQKGYLALVRWPGSVAGLGDPWRWDRPLHDENAAARDARWEFWLLEPFRHCALIECRIETGRYHQIRRHLNHCGRHVLGDTTHGKGRLNALYRERYGLDRLFLPSPLLAVRPPRNVDPRALRPPVPQG